LLALQKWVGLWIKDGANLEKSKVIGHCRAIFSFFIDDSGMLPWLAQIKRSDGGQATKIATACFGTGLGRRALFDGIWLYGDHTSTRVSWRNCSFISDVVLY